MYSDEFLKCVCEIYFSSQKMLIIEAALPIPKATTSLPQCSLGGFGVSSAMTLPFSRTGSYSPMAFRSTVCLLTAEHASAVKSGREQALLQPTAFCRPTHAGRSWPGLQHHIRTRHLSPRRLPGASGSSQRLRLKQPYKKRMQKARGSPCEQMPAAALALLPPAQNASSQPQNHHALPHSCLQRSEEASGGQQLHATTLHPGCFI